MTADAIARFALLAREALLGLQGLSPAGDWYIVQKLDLIEDEAANFTDILAADRQAQRERHAALAREIGRGLEPGEAIARAILKDDAGS